MQVAKRAAGPWGDTLSHYPADTRQFLVARAPLAALNSVATENQQTRSIGFRSQLIWDRRGIDIFAWPNQTAGEGIYDFFGWAVMSMAYWYDICLEEKPEVIFRIEHASDDRGRASNTDEGSRAEAPRLLHRNNRWRRRNGRCRWKDRGCCRHVVLHHVWVSTMRHARAPICSHSVTI